MKKLLVVLSVLTLVSTSAFAGWSFSETIFDFSAADTSIIQKIGDLTGTAYRQSSPHGVVVDADGNFWIAFHDGYGDEVLWNDANDADEDGVTTDDTTWVKPLWCISPDGDVIHKIYEFDLPDGGTELIHRYSPHNGSGKGISLTSDGNILFSSYSAVYKFNYQTGECMDYYVPSDIGSITEAVEDENTGLIYHTWVIGGSRPVVILDEDMEEIGLALDTLGYITRSMAMKSDDAGATDLYFGTTWNGWGVPKYHSDYSPTDPIMYSGFEIVDTLGRWDYYDAEEDTTYVVPLWSSSLDWNVDKTKLLVGCLRSSWAGVYGSRWYTIDVEDFSVDTIGVAAPDSATANKDVYVAGGANGPRGGFFTDENTLYTVDFYLWTLDKWTYSATNVEEEPQVAETFELRQNYPNPFNPSTTIPFVLDKNALVTLKVYNMLGQEVATLVNNQMTTAGLHQVKFDASNLATGMYIYRINAGKMQQTRRMMLVK